MGNTGESSKDEIYIILKGKVRLGFPLEYCDSKEKSSFNLIKNHLRKEQDKNPYIAEQKEEFKRKQKKLKKKAAKEKEEKQRTDRAKNVGLNFNFSRNEINRFDIKDDVASMTLLFDQVVNHKGLPLIE